MTIKQYIEKYLADGFTDAQARSFAAQQIILSKIEKSPFVDKVLLKGGVVMYNITQEQRRSTLDLDFDFIRFNIEKDENIQKFVEVLNKKNPEYKIKIKGKPEELHQQDYKGKRIKITISDTTESIKFKMDIGVHTLLAIQQNKMCFSFKDGDILTLLVNPPEQMFSEKLFSLAKIGPTSERYKDIDDMYYLISNKSLKEDVVKQCLSLLTINQPYELKDMYDVIEKAEDCLNNSFFIENYKSNGSWLNTDYQTLKDTILNFIYKL